MKLKSIIQKQFSEKLHFFFSVNPRKETSKYIWTISSYYMFTFHNFLKTRSLQEVLRWNLFHPVKQIIKGNIEKQLSGQSIQKQRVNKGPLFIRFLYSHTQWYSESCQRAKEREKVHLQSSILVPWCGKQILNCSSMSHLSYPHPQIQE